MLLLHSYSVSKSVNCKHDNWIDIYYLSKISNYLQNYIECTHFSELFFRFIKDRNDSQEINMAGVTYSVTGFRTVFILLNFLKWFFLAWVKYFKSKKIKIWIYDHHHNMIHVLLFNLRRMRLWLSMTESQTHKLIKEKISWKVPFFVTWLVLTIHNIILNLFNLKTI